MNDQSQYTSPRRQSQSRRETKTLKIDNVVELRQPDMREVSAGVTLVTELWKDQPGKFFCIATQIEGGDERSWRQKFFRKSEFGKIEQYVKDNLNDRHIFFCPHGFSIARRHSDYAEMPYLLWADLDRVDPHLIKKLKPTIAIESSPGNYVGLWELDKPLTDIKLNHRLTDYTKADSGGWGLAKVLRMPGTINHKAKYKKPQSKVIWDNGTEYKIADLEKELPPVAKSSSASVDRTPSALSARTLLEKHRGKLPHWCQRALTTDEPEQGKRSEMMYKIGKTLIEKFVPPGEAYVLLQGSPWNEKYVGRSDEEERLWEIVEEAIEDVGDDEEGLGVWDIANEWDDNGEFAPIPPRGWLLGNIFCRKFVSSLFGAGGVGKTALRYAQYLSLASGIEITDDHVHQRGRVLIVSLEDDVDELRRRIRATLIHHELSPEDVKGWVFLCAPLSKRRKKVMKLVISEHGETLEGALADELEKEIIKHKIDLVALDPFIKAHSVPENDNTAIDAAVTIITSLASEYNIGIDIPHHVSKGGADPGNADKGRGASSQKDAARLVYTLTPMTASDAELFSIDEHEARSFVRMDSAKVNICPPSETRWFRLVSVSLGNQTPKFPQGDHVQAVEPWSPPSVELDTDTIDAILRDLKAGLPDGQRYSDAPNAKKLAAYNVVVKHAKGMSERRARQIIKVWKDRGLLVSEEYQNPVERKKMKGLIVDMTRKSMIRAGK